MVSLMALASKDGAPALKRSSLEVGAAVALETHHERSAGHGLPHHVGMQRDLVAKLRPDHVRRATALPFDAAPMCVAERTDETAPRHEDGLLVVLGAGRTMDVFGDRTPATGQAGWSLLHRLRRVFRTTVDPWVGPPVASTAAAADAVPAGLCVLVADDNPVNLMLASEMLAYFGIESLQAADGAEAVAMAAKTRIDLILMDLQMPVLDGLGATRQIRRAERDQVRARVPVVAYTSIRGDRRHWHDHGVDDVLDKPCEMQAMGECLLRWCPPRQWNVERAAVAALPGP
jgi:CheY-like chemotaxis protein